jgi:hypothetical protein
MLSEARFAVLKRPMGCIPKKTEKLDRRLPDDARSRSRLRQNDVLSWCHEPGFRFAQSLVITHIFSTKNPKGIPPQSPGLRGTSYPGKR